MSIRASRTIVGAALLALAAGVFWYMKRDTSTLSILTYEDCLRAGYAQIPTDPPGCKTPDGTMYTRIASSSNDAVLSPGATTTANADDLIHVSNIVSGQYIASPLLVKGEARGPWYFEASFPVKLLDGNGNPIAQMPAQAQSDWMTSSFVPFAVTLTFVKPSTATGTLILHNDNPSADPARDQFISIPVRF